MAEHRYRIEGKVRLLLFWATGDEIGGARVTWRETGAGAHAFSLLIGTGFGVRTLLDFCPIDLGRDVELMAAVA